MNETAQTLAVLLIDGQRKLLGPRATKMARWLVRLSTELEDVPVGEVRFQIAQDKVIATTAKSHGVDRGERTLAEIGSG